MAKRLTELVNESFSMYLDLESSSLTFSPDVQIAERAGKKAGQMLGLLRERRVDPDMPLYDFFVGVSTPNVAKALAQYRLRYDVIVVHPGTVGVEYKKTSGHLHRLPQGAALGFPEIYEVLHGTAAFLLQRRDAAGNVLYAAAVITRAGEKILIPPGYEHATANIGPETLVFADLVSADCSNEYGRIQENHGMSYYALKGADSTPVFEPNPSYQSPPVIHVLSPTEVPQLGLTFQAYVYDVLLREPQRFAYLSEPGLGGTDVSYLAKQMEGGN